MPAQQEVISVVIPNYNNAPYLDECLASVMGQTYRGLEIIVIDDCSTDASRDIITRHAGEDERVVPVFNTENIGVARNRHKGLMMSAGCFVTTLDSDDKYWRADKLAREYELLVRKRETGFPNSIVFSGIVLIDKNGTVIGKQHDTIQEGSIMNDIVRRTCMIPRDFLFTREQYEAVGGFDAKIPIYEDWDLKIRLAKKNQFYYSGIDGIGYRRHGSGLSSASPLYHAGWLLRIFAKNFFLLETERIQTSRVLGALIYKMFWNYLKKRLLR